MQLVKVMLPEDGWKTYSCQIDELKDLYDEIYLDGALDYEIEDIDSYGNCKIPIYRK